MNLSGDSPFRVRRRGRTPIQINSSSSGLTTLKQLLSGYEEEFVDEVDEELTCLICKFPLRMPMLTTCGHRFCKGCLDQCFERQTQIGQQLSCPYDRQALSKGREHIFPDMAIERKIQSLKVKCDGCGLIIELRKKNAHKNICPQEIVLCTNNNCKETIPRKGLEEHVNVSCRWKLQSCVHCDVRHPACLQAEHQQECKKFPVMCPNGCGHTCPREQIKVHTYTDCPEKFVPCTNNNCIEKIPWKDLEEHVKVSCQWRLQSCVHCGVRHPACRQAEHQQLCKKFPVMCPNGCRQTFPREQTENHMNTNCPEKIVPCTNKDCKEKMSRKGLEEHVNISCQWRLQSCVYCGVKHIAYQQAVHQQQCKKCPKLCPNGCGGLFTEEQIKDHTDKDCPRAIFLCRYAKLGCPKKIRRCEESDHLQSSSTYHLDLACGKLLKSFEEHEELKKENEKCQTTIKNLEKMLIDTRKECESLLKKRTENLEKQINDLQKFKSNHQKIKQDLAHVQSGTENLQEQINYLEKFKSNQQNLEQDLAHVQSQLETKVNRVEMQVMTSVEHNLIRIEELEIKLKNKDEKRSRWRFW